MITDTTIKNKLELIEDGEGDVHWFTTTKMPLKSSAGVIVGVEGITRDARRSTAAVDTYNVFKYCMSYLHKNYMHAIYIEDLADMCYISPSTFERKFKKHFAYIPPSSISSGCVFIHPVACSPRVTVSNKQPLKVVFVIRVTSPENFVC